MICLVQKAGLALILGLGMMCGVTCAAAADQDLPPAETWDLSHLMARMAEVPSAQERFTESKSLAVLNTPLLLSGQLAYRRPDRLEKHVLSPYEEHLIVEGDRLTLINQDGTKQIALHRYPLIRAFVESIRGTLAGDSAALKRFYRVSLSGTRRRWTLRLDPLEPQLAEYVRFIELTGTDTRIHRVDIQEAGGDRSMMMIQRETS